jgi:hypothetical protein
MADIDEDRRRALEMIDIQTPSAYREALCLRRLGERLKLRLLARTTRGVMPTPAGEQLA